MNFVRIEHELQSIIDYRNESKERRTFMWCPSGILKNHLFYFTKSRKLMKHLTLVGIIVILSCALAQAQNIPQYINYQGKLTDTNGKALAGTYTLEFNIYGSTSPTDVLPVWGPQVFDNGTQVGHGAKVPVVDGYFNVILGPKDASALQRSLMDAFSGPSRYLGIKVNSGQEISPRQQILTTPYAQQAAKAAQAALATHHSNIIPPGTIVAFWGDAAPPGWRICDGTNGTPDLRGLFLRGHNRNRTDGWQDPAGDRSWNSPQWDAFRSHPHDYGDWYFSESTYGNCGNLGSHSSDWDNCPLEMWRTTAETGDVETRPKNMAVNYIMKMNFE